MLRGTLLFNIFFLLSLMVRESTRHDVPNAGTVWVHNTAASIETTIVKIVKLNTTTWQETWKSTFVHQSNDRTKRNIPKRETDSRSVYRPIYNGIVNERFFKDSYELL